MTGITPVSIGTLAENGNPAFGQPTTAGDLLIAWVAANSSSSTFDTNVTGTGWTLAGHGGGAFVWTSIWYRQNCGTAETPPTFSSGGSDLWSQAGEFSGAATSSVLDQTAAGASGAAAFTAPDAEGGELITSAWYWNGNNTGGTVTIAIAGNGAAQFTDSNGGTINGTLTWAGSAFGQYAGNLYGVAGITGSVPHTVRLAESVFANSPGAVIASFKPATPVSSALTAVTSSLPGRFTGIPYQGTNPVGVAVTGGTPPYTWSVTAGSLPTGLSISASTGYITGTPATAGTYSFTVHVADSAAASVNIPLSITITASPAVVSTTTYPPTQQTYWYVPVADPEFTGIGPDLDVNVNPNVWGPILSPQCTQTQNVQSAHQWYITGNFTDPSAAVHTFPNTGAQFPLDPPVSWQHMAFLATGWDVYMDTGATVVASACYDLFMDKPFNGQTGGVPGSAEVMAHFCLRNRGGSGTNPYYATGLQFGGYQVGANYIPATTWSLAYKTGDGAAYFDLGSPSDTYASMDTGALDWVPMFRYLVSHNILPPDAKIKGFSVGFEVCTTNGNTNTFVYNDAWWHGITLTPGPAFQPSIVNRAVTIGTRIG